MDKKKNGSILIMIGMIMFIVSFLSFLNHIPDISAPPSKPGDINIPKDGTIVYGNNNSGSLFSKGLITEDNDTLVSILDMACAILNLVTACFSGYVAYIGYKMQSENSHKKAKLREQKFHKAALTDPQEIHCDLPLPLTERDIPEPESGN